MSIDIKKLAEKEFPKLDVTLSEDTYNIYRREGFVKGYQAAAQSQQLSWVSEVFEKIKNMSGNHPKNYQIWLLAGEALNKLQSPPIESERERELQAQLKREEKDNEELHSEKFRNLKEIQRLKEENAALTKLLHDRDNENSASFKLYSHDLRNIYRRIFSNRTSANDTRRLRYFPKRQR